MGRTNDATLLDTPTRSSTAFSVTGSVAPEELVENAIKSGSRMFAKWMRGEMRPSRMRTRGSVMKRWIVSPDAIVTTYSASGRKESNPVVPTMRVMSPYTPIGRKAMMPVVSRIIARKSASNSSTTTVRLLSGMVVRAAPKTIAKKMSASMSAVAAAWITFSGTTASSRSTAEAGVSSGGRSPAVVSTMFAPTPGRIRFTISSPTVTARKLESR